MSSSGAPPHAKRHVSFVVIGHSQCGKSTVVGSMLQLTNSVADDTFESVEAAANIAGQTMRRFAWISDKTKDERQRLHTILPKLWCLDGDDLRISLIDTPGHRSCALMCIASMCMADVALVVVSANRGNFEEGIGVQGGTRMQLLAAYALGIKSVVVAVSQLDDASCSFGESRFREIEERMRMLLRKVGFNPHHVVFVPVAAVFGDCIVQRSPRISWYEGPPLLSAMQDVRAMQKYGEKPLRACVLYKMHVGGVGVVLFVRVLTGLLRTGMSLSLCLAGSSHEVISIQMHHTPLNVAQCGDVVGVHLKGNVDKCERGDILSDTRSGKCVETTSFTAHMCIVHHPTQIKVGYVPVVTAHTTHVPCRVAEILSLLDKSSGQVIAQAPTSVKRGDVCVVRMTALKPIALESFADYPPLGRICWFDSGCIVAVGVIKTTLHAARDILPASRA